MGASFNAYKLEEVATCRMGYSHVHHYRILMLEAMGRLYENGADWYSRYREALNERDELKMEALFEEIESCAQKENGQIRERLIGCHSFCNHSDCDGEWGEDSCELIAIALRMTLDTLELDEDDREALERLRSVFLRGSDPDCEVRIT